MKHLFFLLLIVAFSPLAHSQTYISVTPQGTVPISLLQIFLPITPQYEVMNYKVLYNTTDVFGEPYEASGLLSIPVDRTTAFPVTVYMHGTAVERDKVPSNPTTEERYLAYALATSGYIAVAPDYIGLGDGAGFHPYVHADSESQAGKDMLLAVRQFMDDEGIPYNDQLFVTGYSQGGHAAQALQRDLQTDPANDSLIVTAGAHLSGPYSISEVMREATLTEGQPTLPGFIVYTYVSYSNVYGLYDSLGEAFVQPYLGVIDSFDRELIDGPYFNYRLDTLLVEREERLVDMFQDSIVDQIEQNDPESAIIQALRQNDTYAWAPAAPTLLYYCTDDDQVPFENAILADSVMRELGSTSVVLESGGALDHQQCVQPAVTRALEFFDSYAVRNSVSTRNGRLEIAGLRLAPNPAGRGQQLILDGLPTADYRYDLLDLSGRKVQSGNLVDQHSLTVGEHLNQGMHLLRLTRSDGQYLVRKVMLR